MAQDRQARLAALHSFEHGKIVSAREAVALIRDGDTVATAGFVGIGFAENIAVALEQRFLDRRAGRSRRHRQPARPDARLRRRARATARSAASTTSATRAWSSASIGGHWGLVPKLQALAVANQIEAYNLPQGVISHLFRDIAAGKPGPPVARRPRHLRRSAPRRRQDQRRAPPRTWSR